MGVFAGQGFETIAPDILQPADVFLERSGEKSVPAPSFSPIPPAANSV